MSSNTCLGLHAVRENFEKCVAVKLNRTAIGYSMENFQFNEKTRKLQMWYERNNIFYSMIKCAIVFRVNISFDSVATRALFLV